MLDHHATLRRWLDDHRGILVRISRAYAVDAGDVDDLQQEILLALWRSLPSFRGDAKPSTWIFQVALNVALSRRRSNRRRPAHTSIEDTNEPSSDGERAALQRMEWRAVLRALRAMAPVDRAVLILALEGASQQEIADVLGITASHAGVKLHRARRRLAERLEA
jgi:RNA polymerase sigma-70 factor (ECF subfamily)